MKVSIEVDAETAEALNAWAAEAELPAEDVAGKLFTSIWRPGVLTREDNARLLIERMKRARTNGMTGDELIAFTRGEG